MKRKKNIKKRKLNRTHTTNTLPNSIEIRLEAAIVLLSEILSQIAKEARYSKIVENAKEKSAAVLVSGGITQARAAKLLGIQVKRVNKAVKKIKI